MLTIITSIILGYLLITLFLTYLVHELPRRPVNDKPDWGQTRDEKIPTSNGGFLEVWRIEPEGVSKGIVVLAHGWSRNRGRMVQRARIFGRWGYTVVIHSARDHGGSSPQKMMNGMKFAEDIEAVLEWIDEPVILYGHSIGSVGAIIAANRKQDKVKLLFLEASYAHTKEALLSLYRWFNTFFGIFFAPVILFWMDIFYKYFYKIRLESISPVNFAPGIQVPVMLIHGEKDNRFPVAFVEQLKNSFAPGQAELFIAKDAGHSDSSYNPEYKDAVSKFLAVNLNHS
jgi:pimeloyl-ACP methyl ester carboxylesterase